MSFIRAQCEECRLLDETWEKLAADWEGHAVGLVGRVDCSDPLSDILCEEYSGVLSLPLLLYGDPDSPEFYQEDDLSYDVLSAFAKEHISNPPCNVQHLEHCGETERKTLTDFLGKSREELEQMEKQVDERVTVIEQDYDVKIAEIQLQYSELIAEFNNEIDKIRRETNYKWLQQVLHHLDQKDPSYGDEL